MLHAKNKWVVTRPEAKQRIVAEKLSTTLQIPALVAELLVQRGIQDPEEAIRYLEVEPGFHMLHDPLLMKHMSEAVQRIQVAIKQRQRIRIYGDYDADGVSSTSLLVELFRMLDYPVDYYIPHREQEGYGLHVPALEKAAADGIDLIITVDTGISAVEQAAYAASRGIDLIITDHHEPPQQLPQAVAVINPKQHDCSYPFKGLAGAGVAFKLAHALLGEPPLLLAELAALGTIADLMPLTDENRVLVKLGLRQLSVTSRPGLRALAEVAGVELSQVTSTQVAFGLAPRINAAGRLAHANAAVSLLIATDEHQAAADALRLDRLNKQRQQLVDEITAEAELQWEARCEEKALAGEPPPEVMVLMSPNWPLGIVGIVAARLVEKHYRPALVFGKDPLKPLLKGSARTIEGFDLYAALSSCAELLAHYGGHQAAAGLALAREQLPALEEALCAHARQTLAPDDWQRKLRIDGVVRLSDVTLETIGALARLEPFGAGNLSPRLLLSDVTIEEARPLGKSGKHLRLVLQEDGRRVETVSFGNGELAQLLSRGAVASVVGELAVNEWNGSRKPQVMLQDIRIQHVQLLDYRQDAEREDVLSGWLARMADNLSDIALLASNSFLQYMNGQQQTLGQQQAAAGRAVVPVLEPETRLSDSCWTYEALPERLECKTLLLVDCPPSAAALAAALRRCTSLERVVACYRPARRLRAGFPGREHFAAVYQALRKFPVSELQLPAAVEQLSRKLGWETPVLDMMLRVFADLSFIELQASQLVLYPFPARKELSDSAVYREAEAAMIADQVLAGDTKTLAAWIQRQTADTADIAFT